MLGFTNFRLDKCPVFVQVGQTLLFYPQVGQMSGQTNVQVGQMSCLCLVCTKVAFLALGRTNVDVSQGRTIAKSDKCWLDKSRSHKSCGIIIDNIIQWWIFIVIMCNVIIWLLLSIFQTELNCDPENVALEDNFGPDNT